MFIFKKNKISQASGTLYSVNKAHFQAAVL